MPLSQTEIDNILIPHISNSRIVQYQTIPISLGGAWNDSVFSNPSDQIAFWYNSSATEIVLENLLLCMTPLDMSLFFGNQDFPSWFSSFCEKWHNTNQNLTNALNVVNHPNNLTIDQIAFSILQSLLKYNLTSHSMQSIFSEIGNRQITELATHLTWGMAAEGMLETTSFKQHLCLELCLDEKRWEHLNLSEAPSSTEISTILNP
jgi:hypothetical protein